jgi:hypothetical protein
MIRAAIAMIRLGRRTDTGRGNQPCSERILRYLEVSLPPETEKSVLSPMFIILDGASRNNAESEQSS